MSNLLKKKGNTFLDLTTEGVEKCFLITIRIVLPTFLFSCIKRERDGEIGVGRSGMVRVGYLVDLPHLEKGL